MSAPNQPPNYDIRLLSGQDTSRSWYRWFQSLGGGLSITITTAKLTGGGANGSMTFTNGILTASKPAT